MNTKYIKVWFVVQTCLDEAKRTQDRTHPRKRSAESARRSCSPAETRQREHLINRNCIFLEIWP